MLGYGTGYSARVDELGAHCYHCDDLYFKIVWILVSQKRIKTLANELLFISARDNYRNERINLLNHIHFQ